MRVAVKAAACVTPLSLRNMPASAVTDARLAVGAAVADAGSADSDLVGLD